MSDGDATTLVSFIESTAPRYSVTPVQVSAALGVSLSTAEAELCGLSGLCGGRYTIGDEGDGVVSFSFPPDFAELSSRALSRQSVRLRLGAAASSVYQILRAAMGLFIIFSLCVLALGLVVVFMAVKARTRGAGGGLRLPRAASASRALYHLNNLSFLYYVLNPTAPHPFFASFYSTVLCCRAATNPLVLLSPWFWLRARSVSRRRRFGWSVPTFNGFASNQNNNDDGNNSSSSSSSSSSPTAAGHQLLLSNVDQFIFGTLRRKPSEADIVKIRFEFLKGSGFKGE